MASWYVSLWCSTLLAAAAESVDYGREVQPILAAHCCQCHGSKKQESGLRLDTATALRAGGYSGPAIVAGSSGESLLIKAVTGAEDATAMPPEGPKLTASQIATLRRWIDEGAKTPTEDKSATSTTRKSDLWSLKPIVRPAMPAVKAANWVCNPIDAFILARLEQQEIAPAPEADRVTLIRRLCLDLLGLPPTIAEVDAFVDDQRADAYDRLVDRLLASPHYGERWGRNWLDVARYADSNGYTNDNPRQMWKYRDWVIDALNRDLPFDQFTIEQFAGDMLPQATLDQIVATGFHRNTQINEEGGTDPEEFRVEAVVDRVATTGEVFLGLTLGCARCHDHKFDPISQQDFYQVFALLNNADEPTIPVPSAADALRFAREIEPLEVKLQAASTELSTFDRNAAAGQPDWERKQDAKAIAAMPEALRAAIAVAAAERTAEQRKEVTNAYHESLADRKPLANNVAELGKVRKALTANLPTTLVMRERAEPRTTHILVRGEYLRDGRAVKPNVPAVLPPFPRDVKQPTRLDFARWLVDRKNPLVSRVTMNRVWQQYFGRGIVETTNDFGSQSAPPTHPELLDWLASEFMARDWSMKAMHRLIVTSATYRQSSHSRPELATIDADNRLLARQSRIRVEAEVVRDLTLASAALLTAQIGGPSVFPPQPDGVMKLTITPREWKTSTGADRYRRGMYTYHWRSTPHPYLKVLDGPDASTSCTRRNRSNTPLQALTLLNDEASIEAARTLAARVLNEAPRNDARKQAEHAFRLCLARRPTSSEVDSLVKLVAREIEDPSPTTKPTTPPPPRGEPAGASDADLAAWTSAARALLNVDEFMTRE